MSNLPDLSRRKFLKMAGIITGSGFFATVLNACNASTSTIAPTITTTATTAVGSTALPITATPAPVPISTVLPLGTNVDGYLAVAPSIWQSGQAQNVAVTLFNGQSLTAENVTLELLKNGQSVSKASELVQGRTNLALPLPASVSAGDYTLSFQAGNLQAQTAVQVQQSTLIFLETDKPIYKPGQTIHIRAVTLDSTLKPVSLPLTLEVSEAKGIKVFKQEVTTDQFGMASADLPLSTEPNLGDWQVMASVNGQIKEQLTVRVETYVLPKYQIDVTTTKNWVLASDAITGTVKAEYSYGKPVQGEVEIRVLKYIGTWQEFANSTQSISGSVDFSLPAVQYVAGTPANGGQGNVQLEVTVREKATGYEEKTTQLLTVVSSTTTLKLIPENLIFKPSLPLNLLVVAQTPDNKPINADVTFNINYTKHDMSNATETRQLNVSQGLATLQLNPPAEAISLSVYATSGSGNNTAYTTLSMTAAYSPSNSFIYLQQISQGSLKVGDTAKFKVNSTNTQATIFYYEVTARGTLVFSSYSTSPNLEITLTPAMAPTARLVVYQLLPSSEVAADYLPISIEASYPQALQVKFDKTEAAPGDSVNLQLQTQGPAKVGLSIVDRSVFILAENRLNLAQVFDALEKLYEKPQVELESSGPAYRVGGPIMPGPQGGMVPNGGGVAIMGNNGTLTTSGSQEIFKDAGLVVMSNLTVPQGQSFQQIVPGAVAMNAAGAGAVTVAATTAAAATTTAAASSSANTGLAQVQRVRQFFPETWVWSDATTDAKGQATQALTAPDSITTWMLHAVALSPNAGLGISDAQLTVMQPFFIQLDLVYSAIRGEQFPVKVDLYNYGDKTENFTVELTPADWFTLSDQSTKIVTVNSNDINSVSFNITPQKLGTSPIKVSARSSTKADAVIQDFLVEPEGVARELVGNQVAVAGQSYSLDLSIPDGIISGSGRAFLALTGNYLTQTIQGLDSLLQMPFGCGEQNMILFAPDVSIAQYLKDTGQAKPEVMAKAQSLMLTGYQRELTYRRNDASFSAFGNSDASGSLWLTAFVIKTFAQAKNLIYIDENLLSQSAAWIKQHQNPDGSFDPVGFMHHESLLGGLTGKPALTAFVALALLAVGETSASGRAVSYLENSLATITDAYTAALTAYILELAKSSQRDTAYNKLMALAKQSSDGLYWGDGDVQPVASGSQSEIYPQPKPSATVETTGYALLALLAQGDNLNASAAARWMASKRNAFGGWESTQDTVVGLQGLATFAIGSKSDINNTLTLTAGSWQKQVQLTPENADVLQTIELPLGDKLNVAVQGKGQAILQTVRRFNVAQALAQNQSAFQITVDYGTTEIQVNNKITVHTTIQFNPPQPQKAGMVVLDVALPTGFVPDSDSLAALAKQQPKIKRYDVAGRKVIVYIDDMNPGAKLSFDFQAVAQYPVKAQAVTSQVYSYYQPDWKGEHLGGAITVTG